MSSDPTARVPVEVLAEIFLTLKHGGETEARGFQCPWVRVTWVCKRWREIALNLPSLWTSVEIRGRPASLDAARTLMERAGNRALDLHVSCRTTTRGDISRIFDAVQLSGKVVGALQVRYLDHASHEVHDGLCSINIGDRLTSLELLCSKGGYGSPYQWTFDPSKFPSLQSLTVKAALPIATGPLMNLRRLALIEVFTQSALDEREKGDYLHEFLRFSPVLEELSLRDALGDATSMPYHDTIPVVTLPHLRSLCIDGPLLDIPNTLAPLRLSALRRLSIDVDPCGINDGSAFFEVFPHNSWEVLPPLSRTNSLAICFGSTTHMENAIIKLRGATVEDQGNDRYEWSVSLSSIHGDQIEDGEYLEEQCEGLLDNLPPLLDCANMVRLELHVSHGLPVQYNWSAWLSQFPKVRILCIGSGPLVEQIVVALKEDSAGLLFPELQELSICMGNPESSPRYPYLPSDLFGWLLRKDTTGQLHTVKVRVPDSRTPEIQEEWASAQTLLKLLCLAMTQLRDARVVAEDCTSCHAVYELGESTYCSGSESGDSDDEA